MKHFVTDKKGITLLEGLIAILLLAVVAIGTFSVMLSASRQQAHPDIQEEMLFAVERANNLLQVYTYKLATDTSNGVAPSAQNDLIPNLKEYFGDDPLSVGTHNDKSLRKLLPTLCDWDNTDDSPSTFTYTVTQGDDTNLEVTGRLGITSDTYYNASPSYGGWEETDTLYKNSNQKIPVTQVQFNIVCNGYTL